MWWFEFFSVFVFMFVVDIVWAYYFLCVEKRLAFKSGICSVLIYVLGIYSTSKFIEDKTFILPGILGAFLGTYFTIRKTV